MVFSVFKDALAVDAAHHDMINSCPRVDAAFPWPDTILFGTLTCPLCPMVIHILYNCLLAFSIASCSMTSNSEKSFTLLNLTRGFPFRSTKPYKVSSSSSVMP